ncbi:arginase family protein [Kaustia mangrovi]|uniref:Arginase family protein n=1 Tax=Kaustia mangrovi TaxID=2593653 RepID=A0A7S8C644_9HYPH|nr:arginase family protein [Kaustia mangrovi]QPC44103.1 arginase family protein [Kaustia mangrovi]
MTVSDEEFAARKAAMQPWYWWGIPTFFKCPWNEDPSASDIALVGVPHSSGNGSTERDQHLAPRAVRDMSGRYRRAHETYGFSPWDILRVNDLGDVPLPEAMANDISVGHIEDYFHRLDRAGARPVSIGGDHAITGPILKALGGKDTALAGGRKLSLVHFDAHRDDYDYLPHWLGNRRSAAHWAAYSVQEGHVDPGRSIQLGMRGNPLKPRTGNPADSDLGYEIMPAETVFDEGLDETAQRILDRVGDNPVYITFDLDVLDVADAPGVSNLEAGYRGLRAYEAIRLLRTMRGLDIVGADIVCMMPTRDNPNQITALTATVLMFEMICLIGDRIRQR